MATNGGSADPDNSEPAPYFPAPYFPDDDSPSATPRRPSRAAAAGALLLLIALVAAVSFVSRGSARPPLVIRLSGAGSTQTVMFEVPSQWEIETDFGCHHLAVPGNFTVWVIDPNGLPNALDTERAPNSWGAGGAARIIEPVGGTLSLQVYSDCSWSVRVLQ